MPDLGSLPTRPELIENELIQQLQPEALSVSRMSQEERNFVNGLVRIYRPEKILEIGVYRGGGTCVLLNAIHDIPEASVTSIDLLQYLRIENEEIEVADAAKKLYKDHPRWNLITGKDPVEIIEQLGGPFDFVVLDTAHIHPVESLNFLTIFPYLTPDAVIVLHDINLFALKKRRSFPQISFACKLLYDTITARKLEPVTYCRANIGAFQLLPYTKDHIEDIFSMLSFPWGIYPKHLPQIDSFIHKHYSEKNYQLFKHALHQARTKNWDKYGFKVIQISQNRIEDIRTRFDEIIKKKHLIFYGAGYNAKNLFRSFKELDLRIPDEIWDINNENITVHCGVPVVAPHFDSLNDDNYGMIITNSDRDIICDIINKNKEAQFTKWLTLNVLWAIGKLNGADLRENCRRFNISPLDVAFSTDIDQDY